MSGEGKMNCLVGRHSSNTSVSSREVQSVAKYDRRLLKVDGKEDA